MLRFGHEGGVVCQQAADDDQQPTVPRLHMHAHL
jgi:hypothetical protein